jgi:putative iron-only hydrogenase system regulator
LLYYLNNLENKDAFWFNEGEKRSLYLRINALDEGVFFTKGNNEGKGRLIGRACCGSFVRPPTLVSRIQEANMRIAVIGAVLENPAQTQKQFNGVISAYKGIVRGRMGIPFDAEDIGVVSVTIAAEIDEINALTGKLGNIPGVVVKTAVSREIGRGE